MTLPDEHHDRIDALREELEATNAGPYASVETADVLAYLLDLADAVEDPDRRADPDTLCSATETAVSAEAVDAAAGTAFDRDRVRAELESRNRRGGDEDADGMDLYEIAAAFDVTGRSDMTKAALIDATLDAAAEMAVDPFSWAGVNLDPEAVDEDDADEGDADTGGGEADVEDEADVDGEPAEATPDGATSDNGGDADGGSSGQLNAMLSLLDTHADKWREGDGDARYEVDLPDGSVETARTKDDVRAILFKKY